MQGYVPDCEDDRDLYKLVQCHEKRGCFCVNSMGQYVSYSEHGLLIDSISQDKEEYCSSRLAMAESDVCAISTSGLDCDADGRFALKQCSESGCFCVDPYGTRFGPSGSADLDCAAANADRRDKYPCLTAREEAYKEHIVNLGISGVVLPSCSDDGLYDAAQCVAAACVCVDIANNEKDGTILTVGQASEQCKSLRDEEMRNECAMALKQWYSEEPAEREEKPVCETDGGYSSRHCENSECHCANYEGVPYLDTEHSEDEDLDCALVRQQNYSPIRNFDVPKQTEIGSSRLLSCSLTFSSTSDQLDHFEGLDMLIDGVSVFNLPSVSLWSDFEFERSINTFTNSTRQVEIKGQVGKFSEKMDNTNVACVLPAKPGYPELVVGESNLLINGSGNHC